MAINHTGWLDFTFAGLAAHPAGRLVRFMAKEEIFEAPGRRAAHAGHEPHPRRPRGRGRGLRAPPAHRCGRARSSGSSPRRRSAGRSSCCRSRAARCGWRPRARRRCCPRSSGGRSGSGPPATDARSPCTASRSRSTCGDRSWSERGDDAEEATQHLHSVMETALHAAQERYPVQPKDEDDSWWLPARLGGTAPTPAQAEVIAAERAAARARTQGPRGGRGSSRHLAEEVASEGSGLERPDGSRRLAHHGQGTEAREDRTHRAAAPGVHADQARRPEARRTSCIGVFLVVFAVFIGIGARDRQPVDVRHPRHPGRRRWPRCSCSAVALEQAALTHGRGPAGRRRRRPQHAAPGLDRSPRPSAVTRNQDLVHRAVGRPGVVLVARGTPRGRRQPADRRAQARPARRPGRPRPRDPRGRRRGSGRRCASCSADRHEAPAGAVAAARSPS